LDVHFVGFFFHLQMMTFFSSLFFAVFFYVQCHRKKTEKVLFFPTHNRDVPVFSSHSLNPPRLAQKKGEKKKEINCEKKSCFNFEQSSTTSFVGIIIVEVEKGWKRE
jgi:hypothetical protein